MRRSEKLILVRDTPATIVAALDALLAGDGYERVATRSIREDFSPLLHEEDGPLVFVLSPPRDEWVACFTSLALADEWELVEALAAGLEQPVVYALFDAVQDLYMYRYFAQGELREEALPEASAGPRLDETTTLQRLQQHGIGVDLVDDRIAGFDQEHLVVGYLRGDRG